MFTYKAITFSHNLLSGCLIPQKPLAEISCFKRIPVCWKIASLQNF